MPDRDKKDHMNQTMEAVPAGTRFTFRIYFDRVNREQLYDLVWLVCLGENRSDGKYQYKLGHAKPLGYGSVKMVVKDCVTRTVREDLTMSTRHIDVPVCPPCSFDTGSKTFQSIRRMSDSTATKGYDVAYLTGVNKKGNEQIFIWFQHNRANPSFLLTLPEPWESNLALPTKRKAEDQYPQRWRVNADMGGSRVSTGGPSRQQGTFIGKEVEGMVQRVLPHGETFIRLDGPKANGFYRQQSHEQIMEGDVLTVRIESYDEKRGNFRVRPVR